MEHVKESGTADSHTRDADTIGYTADVEEPSRSDNVTHATDASTKHAAGTTTAGIRDTPGEDAVAKQDQDDVTTATLATDAMHDTAPVPSLEAIPPSNTANEPQQDIQFTSDAPNVVNDALAPSNAAPQASESISHQDLQAVQEPEVSLQESSAVGAAVASTGGNQELDHEDKQTTSSTNEQEWPLKSMYWPPFAEYPRQVKILMQDLNGPCSFLALCNVLLLRGNIHIPQDQKSATFSQLSGLVADYLLRASPTTSTANSETHMTLKDSEVETSHKLPQESLDFALNTLPKTLSGLDVNINFITGGFSESSTATSPSSSNSANNARNSELDLFKLANVDFRHGWLASEDDKETYEVLLSVANDYDTAVNVLVEGDAIAEGNITGNSNSAANATSSNSEQTTDLQTQSPTVSNATRLERLFEDLSMEPNKQAKVYQATIIQRFLQQTSTQLTYAGLFNLSESLPQGSLCALFRNSHFSVLYRRPDASPQPSRLAEDGAQAGTASRGSNDNNNGQGRRLPQATLFQLVTDQALLHEPNAIWESLEDIDGSASIFFDSALQPARIRQDWVSRSERDPAQVEDSNATHDADMALAAQLQQDEYDADEQARHRQHNNQRRRDVQSTRNTNDSATPREHENARPNPAASAQAPDTQRSTGGRGPENLSPKVLHGLGAKTAQKEKDKSSDKKSKKDCIIC